MKIEFNGKQYCLPPPLAQESERLIRVHRYAVLPCEGLSSEGRFRFSYPIKKLFFFLIHEGIRLTWHKVRASTLQRKIAAERHLVFMEGLVADGEQVVAVAPMDCPAAEYVAVHKKCLTIVPSGKDYSWCLQVLSDHFQRYPENIEALYCYSSYSGMELSFSLKQLLEDAATENWHLKKNTTLHQHFSVLSKEGVDRKPIRVKRKKPNCELFLAGAGAYAYAYVVPYMKGVFHHTIVDLNPLLVAIMQEKFGTPYVITPYPFGLDNSIEFLESVTNGLSKEVNEEFIAIEKDRIKERVERIFIFLQGIYDMSVAVIGDGGRAFDLAKFLSDELCLNVKVLAITSRNHISLDKTNDDYFETLLIEPDRFEMNEEIKSKEVEMIFGSSMEKKLAWELNVPLLRSFYPVIDAISISDVPYAGFTGTIQLTEKIINAVINNYVEV